MRGSDPPDEPWLVHRSTSGPKGALWRSRNGKRKIFPNSEPMRLIGWLLPGKIRETDRERVTFIIRTVVHPPERADDSLLESVVEGV
jgi:hypothetical protein